MSKTDTPSSGEAHGDATEAIAHSPYRDLRNILHIAILAFFATKVLTYENIENVVYCWHHLSECVQYLMPIAGMSLLIVVILEYGRIADSGPSHFRIDILIMFLCLAALQTFNSSFQRIPNLDMRQ